MKATFLIIFLFCFSNFIQAQDLKLSSAIAPSAGQIINNNPINLSKWQIGEIHLVVLQSQNGTCNSGANWDISAFPNPFAEYCNLKIKTTEKGDFSIQVTDVLGENRLSKVATTVISTQVIKLDLKFLAPGVYFISVTNEDQNLKQVIKVQKI